jgi:hypothetical protein
MIARPNSLTMEFARNDQISLGSNVPERVDRPDYASSPRKKRGRTQTTMNTNVVADASNSSFELNVATANNACGLHVAFHNRLSRHNQHPRGG